MGDHPTRARRPAFLTVTSPTPDAPSLGTEYDIVVAGSIGARTVRALGIDGEVVHRPDATLLRCRFVDQSALHGVLERIRDLGLDLVDVHRLA